MLLTRKLNKLSKFKMAASITWRNRLKNHKIFADLALSNKDIRVDSECLNLIAVKDGEIYVWDPNTMSVMTTNLKNLIKKTERDDVSRVEYQVKLKPRVCDFANNLPDVNTHLIDKVLEELILLLMATMLCRQCSACQNAVKN